MPAKFSLRVALSQRRRLFGAATAAVAALLIIPSIAAATTIVSVSAGTLRVATGAGEVNNVQTAPQQNPFVPGVVRITEFASGVQIGARQFSGCEREDGNTFRCTGVSSISADLGAGDDQLFTDATSIPTEVDGGDGDDKLTTSGRDDSLDGGPGDDLLNAVPGNDFLDGGTGNDVLQPGSGADRVEAGSGDDVIRADEFSPPAEPDRVACQSGFDRATIDLQDTFVDRAPACEVISEAPVDEHPTVKVARRAQPVQGGDSLRLRLSCPRKAKRRCQGTLTLTDRGERFLGRGSYRIARGEAEALTVDVNRRGQDAVDDGELITATALERDPRGRLKQTIVQLALGGR